MMTLTEIRKGEVQKGFMRLRNLFFNSILKICDLKHKLIKCKDSHES